MLKTYAVRKSVFHCGLLDMSATWWPKAVPTSLGVASICRSNVWAKMKKITHEFHIYLTVCQHFKGKNNLDIFQDSVPTILNVIFFTTISNGTRHLQKPL